MEKNNSTQLYTFATYSEKKKMKKKQFQKKKGTKWENERKVIFYNISSFSTLILLKLEIKRKLIPILILNCHQHITNLHIHAHAYNFS